MKGLFEGAVRDHVLKPMGWKQSLRSRLYLVMLYLFREYSSRFKLLTTGNSGRHLSRLVPVFQKVESCFGQASLTVADLAGEARVSEVYLRRLFQSALGITPIHFLQRRRVQQACHLLRGSEKSIKQVAEECGFSDVYYFHRAFKNQMRITAGAYQRSELADGQGIAKTFKG